MSLVESVCLYIRGANNEKRRMNNEQRNHYEIDHEDILGEGVLEEIQEGNQRKTREVDGGSHLRQVLDRSILGRVIQTVNQLPMKIE